MCLPTSMGYDIIYSQRPNACCHLLTDFPPGPGRPTGTQTRLVKLYALLPHPAAPFPVEARQTHPWAPTWHFHEVGKAGL